MTFLFFISLCFTVYSRLRGLWFGYSHRDTLLSLHCSPDFFSTPSCVVNNPIFNTAPPPPFQNCFSWQPNTVKEQLIWGMLMTESPPLAITGAGFGSISCYILPKWFGEQNQVLNSLLNIWHLLFWNWKQDIFQTLILKLFLLPCMPMTNNLNWSWTCDA